MNMAPNSDDHFRQLTIVVFRKSMDGSRECISISCKLKSIDNHPSPCPARLAPVRGRHGATHSVFVDLLYIEVKDVPFSILVGHVRLSNRG